MEGGEGGRGREGGGGERGSRVILNSVSGKEHYIAAWFLLYLL